MRWLILLLLLLFILPVSYASCYLFNNNTFCEVEFGLNIIENNSAPEFNEEIYISKQRFLGNYLFIPVAIGAIIFGILFLLKT